MVSSASYNPMCKSGKNGNVIVSEKVSHTRLSENEQIKYKTDIILFLFPFGIL